MVAVDVLRMVREGIPVRLWFGMVSVNDWVSVVGVIVSMVCVVDSAVRVSVPVVMYTVLT
jgi:hypothetical protein